MMRAFALSMGTVVAIATGLNATVFATDQVAQDNQNPKTNQTKTLEKNEDGHTLTQKWAKANDKGTKAFYHFNEIKDTDPELYEETVKEDRHYHSNTTTTVTVDGQEQTTKRVVVYNINKNKTICNIVEHSETGVTKDGDCNEEKDVSTPVVPDTDGNNEEVKDKPKVEVKPQETAPVKVAPSSNPAPSSLPVTGASPISATLVALLAAIATFVGYASSLALMEYRIKDQI